MTSVATDGSGQTAKQFFLERPPSEAELAALPSNLDAVAIAKVRIVEGLAWVGGRDQSGKPPPPPKALFWGRLEILDVLSGPKEIGEVRDVLFGVRGDRCIIPYGRERKQGEYFVASYIGPDGDRRLWGFPISEEAYVAWMRQYGGGK